MQTDLFCNISYDLVCGNDEIAAICGRSFCRDGGLRCGVPVICTCACACGGVAGPLGEHESGGYQICQSLFAIGTGGLFGMGLGQGMPKSVPVVESDFIFSAIAEEMGVIFCIFLILIYISSFIMFVNIALKMKKNFYKLCAFGLSVVLIFQVF